MVTIPPIVLFVSYLDRITMSAVEAAWRPGAESGGEAAVSGSYLVTLLPC